MLSTSIALHSFDRNFFDILGYWQRPRRSACEDFASRIAAGGALVFWCGSFIVGLILAIVWDEIYVLHPLHLPDPASSINPFLRSSNISLSLQRCTVAPPDADEYFFYDFYTGMPDSLCPQIQAARALYPDQEVALLEESKYKDSIDLSGVRFWLAVLHWASSSATLWGLALLLIDWPYVCCLIATEWYKQYQVRRGEQSLHKASESGSEGRDVAHAKARANGEDFELASLRV
jgi:hypothetical protein